MKYKNYFLEIEKINKKYGKKFLKIKSLNKFFFNLFLLNKKYYNFETLFFPKNFILENKNSYNKKFIAGILAGGMSTRFGGKHKFLLKNKEKISLLGENILKIIEYENNNNLKIPIIIFTDYFTIKSIKNHLKYYSYFGKDKNDFYFVKGDLGYKVKVNKKILKEFGLEKIYKKLIKTKNNFSNTINKDNFKKYLSTSGHYIYNNLILSGVLNKIKNKYLIENEYLIISNCNNIGEKYFKNIINNSNKNLVIGTKKIGNEKADLIFQDEDKIKIIPYFIDNFEKLEEKGNIIFTGTIYLNINSLLKFFENKENFYKNTYYPILKYFGDSVTLYFESCLSDITNYLEFENYFIEREECFVPIRDFSIFK
ncbi:hypothetical protein BKN14_04670 [Candidatus Gracilibacteria bacterium HOT-871]|nr:hypothetical protein BKN14_04670 [Candidatus Gracilibacteria bacterium HOT-871]RKW23042.1 MAG: hypothetical protein D8B46_04130 [Candidatus Gracilibacteria bacterium]